MSPQIFIARSSCIPFINQIQWNGRSLRGMNHAEKVMTASEKIRSQSHRTHAALARQAPREACPPSCVDTNPTARGASLRPGHHTQKGCCRVAVPARGNFRHPSHKNRESHASPNPANGAKDSCSIRGAIEDTAERKRRTSTSPAATRSSFRDSTQENGREGSARQRAAQKKKELRGQRRHHRGHRLYAIA